MLADFNRVSAIKLCVFICSLLPLTHLSILAWEQNLGANPVEKITDSTGIWALRFLLATLAISPIQKISGLKELRQFQRMLGLFAFFYSCLHVLVYLWLEQNFDWPFIIEDLIKHPYVIVGFSAFLLLLALAMTSTRRMVYILGSQTWKRIHRLIYPAAILATIHFFWQVKSDIREPLLYIVLLLILMLLRLPSLQPGLDAIAHQLRSLNHTRSNS